MSKVDELLNLSDNIRYVAIYENDVLEKKTKSGTENASEDESDVYEELLVNPTLLKLTEQRGNIDCGGLDYIIVRYGNFYQLVKQLNNGHLSIAIRKEADPIEVYSAVHERLNQWRK